MVLLGFKCFSSPGRARLWCLLGFKCFSSPGRANAVVLLPREGEAVVLFGLIVSVPQGGRSCGVAWN